MNTRGLTELIVLNLALEKGVISEALFAALVIMALVTTFMAGPVLNRWTRRTTSASRSRPSSSARARRRRRSRRCRSPSSRSSSRRRPTAALAAAAGGGRAAGHLRAAARAHHRAPDRAAARRGGARRAADRALPARRAPRTRSSACAPSCSRAACRRARSPSPRPTSGATWPSSPSARTSTSCSSTGAGRCCGEGVPRGDVGSVLRRAPSDVAVLVAREDAVVAPGADAPLVVPFGGAEHDWAALELGAWLAAATGAPLRLLGAAGEGEEGRREPPAGHRLAARAALRRASPPSRCWPSPGATGLIARGGGRGAARHRALGPLARGGPRARPPRDRRGRARADPLRPPRPARRARWRRAPT